MGRHLRHAFIYVFKEFTTQLGKLSNHVLAAFFCLFVLDCEKYPSLTSLGPKKLVESKDQQVVGLMLELDPGLETSRRTTYLCTNSMSAGTALVATSVTRRGTGSSHTQGHRESRRI